jgi:endonuclease/exonuclease/phosphatase family metal-dependent hydrolase
VVLFVNTHFDHKGAKSRAESAKLMRARIEALREGAPVVVVGDFNTPEGSEPYATLRGERDEPGHLADSFREAHATRGREEGTFNGFRGERGGGRIDWILHTPDVATESCEIVYDSEGGRYPSDHFPVKALLKLGPVARP